MNKKVEKAYLASDVVLKFIAGKDKVGWIRMRKIKFRFRLLNQEGKVLKKIFTLDQIGSGILLGSEFQKILSIDQYVGFKDKDRKEIYEGDIVEIGGDKKKAFVYWNDKFAWWDLEEYEHSLGLLVETQQYKDVKVIGNIYENKELLGKKNEGFR